MRKYSLKLLSSMKSKAYRSNVDGLDVLIKPVPDRDALGVMDPRVYEESRMALLTQYMVPSFYPKVADVVIDKISSVSASKASISIHDKVVIKKVVDVGGMDMHIFMPSTIFNTVPILYFVHGGGYWSGSTEVIEDAMKLLVSTYDVVVFSLDYRLAPHHPVPTGHKDCKHGLDWAFENAHLYQGDVDKLFVGGDSAGGNIAIYLSEDPRIKGQILLYPSVSFNDDRLFDIRKYEINKKESRVIKASIRSLKKSLDLMVKVVNSDDEVLSPLVYEVKRQLPTFMALGSFDVLKFEGLAYAKKLDDIDVIIYEGVSHAFIDKVGILVQSEDCVYEMGDFILNVLSR
jgi:acetyl esterase